MKRQFNHELHKKLMEQGIRQKDLGSMVRLHQSTVSTIIHGAFIPNERTKVKIAKALGCPVQEIFKD
jgi:DNA-binding XRE family transcriptional regulator